MTYDPGHVCDKATSAVRKKTDSLGRHIYMWQCLTCGSPTSSILPHNNPFIINAAQIDAWDHEMPVKWATEFVDYATKQGKTENENWWNEYNAYLATPEWREKSLAVRARDPICQGCRKGMSEEAHHSTYRNVGQEFLFELIALCTRCHKRLHERKKAQNERYTRK